jgi:hypothetical protein
MFFLKTVGIVDQFPADAFDLDGFIRVELH